MRRYALYRVPILVILCYTTLFIFSSVSSLFIFQVHIINLLQDSKFQHFKPVMDTYIESHFAGALSYRDLIKVLKWYMDRIVDAEHQDHIQQVLKASEYIFKYIIQSRRLFSLATGGQNEEEFRVCIHELFMSIRFFLSQENKTTSPVAQTQVCVQTCASEITCASECANLYPVTLCFLSRGGGFR
ncbi:Dedicator of cytokinesis protein 4 [Liparis tanakae]|uniref:Dedicator of cytokinesis protein 4 n=1 Tax=Liparis tanakae TaxID=230148 RepID=A0A4Z2HM01_9TELE|nr:Dedicator of cytokinesis protein 4 [Liparis tanakae]